MKKKNLIILALTILIVICITIPVQAAIVEENVSSGTNNINSSSLDLNTSSASNSMVDNSAPSTQSLEQLYQNSSNEDATAGDPYFSSSASSEEPATTVTSTLEASTDSDLALGNILSIFIIAVGVILILLGIAVLLRLNK